MKKLCCFFLCALLLISRVSAAEESELSQRLAEFRDEHGLDESNFAVSFYDSVTAERCEFNADRFFPVGDVWTFLLHMYYYEKEAAGDFEIPPEEQTEIDEVYKIGGRTLEECRYESIIRGNASVSEQMRAQLGDFRQYQELINREYGHLSADDLPENYYTETVYSARFLMNCMRYLDVRNEDFNGLTAQYRMIQSGVGLGGYSYPYELVHVTDTDGGMICDIAGVSAPEPYLLVCFVGENVGESVLSELNDLFCGYVLETYAQQSAQTVQNNQHTREGRDLTVTADRPIDGALPWLKYAIYAGLALIAVGVTVLLIIQKHQLDKESL